MRYEVIEDLRIRTSKGDLTIQAGQVVILTPEKARALIEKGKVKPLAPKEQVFCYWKDGNVPRDECVKPCMTFSDGHTMSQCRHFVEAVQIPGAGHTGDEPPASDEAARPILDKDYARLVAFIHKWDIGKDDMGLYLWESIEGALESMDNAYFQGDVTAFREALDNVYSLYGDALTRICLNMKSSHKGGAANDTLHTGKATDYTRTES
jgi:hypothetical protein